MIGLGLGLDAALVSLDLAMILVERGDTGELKRLAAEMVPVFDPGTTTGRRSPR